MVATLTRADEDKLVLAGAKKPWVNFGQEILPTQDPKTLMKEAGLDWEVEKAPIFADFNGEKVNTGKEALIRTDTKKVMDVVSPTWNPVQNSEAFDFFTDFVEKGDVEMSAAGQLEGGKLVWALAKVDDSFELFNGDKVDSYLLFTNPHKFGKAIDIRFTPIRIVCNNMITKTLNQQVDNILRMNHRQDFDVEAAKATLLRARDLLDEYREMAEFLGSKRFDIVTARNYFNEVFPNNYKRKDPAGNDDVPPSKNAQLAEAALYTQPGAQFAEGSWWQAYNAVSYLTDHVLGRSEETRLRSAWYGQNQMRKMRALNLAVKYAEAA